jgi:hypothetical protein
LKQKIWKEVAVRLKQTGNIADVVSKCAGQDRSLTQKNTASPEEEAGGKVVQREIYLRK